jgi:predicted P-loop ATPase
MCHRLGFDTFQHAVMICEPGEDQWRELKDTDVFSVGHCLEGSGFKPPAKELLRDAINAVAEKESFDSAQNWLMGLSWDGVPRVREFLAKGFGAEAGEYSEAIGLYLWTALAGRVIEPGCKADMVPVAQGTQGIRKSSAVQALSPSPEFFAELDLGVKEDDLNRLMKGRMVLEMGELAGMRAREVEGLKRFVAAQRNVWTEKWATVPTTYARRCVFFGTTNADTFLADATGSRRWLPFRAGVTGVCDPDWIASNRDQLWAEGAALFRANGVHWRDAERLARDVHEEFTVQDSWDALIARWLETPGFDGAVPSASYVTTVDVLVKALNMQAGQVSRANETRVGAVLQRLGFNRVRRRVDGSLRWVYAKT